MYFGELSTCEDVIKLLKITIDRQKITINLNEAIKRFSKDKGQNAVAEKVVL